MILGDTIAAVATASGRGGIAIVRVSGPEAFAVAERLTGRRPVPGRIALRRVVAAPGRTLDEAVVLAFAAPHSYTGEDVVEFQCHGGTVTSRRILSACFTAGARLARRGEFTQRALLNGRLDCDQAEAVLDLIDARTEKAADAALEGLAGRRRRVCRELYEQTLELSSRLEYALDVDEAELPEGFHAEVRAALGSLRASFRAAIVRANEGRLLREGALVVLAGPPNVGKSSLMNALLEENRAIVSDVPGTTRDSIEEWLDLDGWPIRLVDTAGLRATGDAVEAEGVRRSEALIAQADVVVRLAEGADTVAPNAGRELCVTSKCDLVRGAGLNVSAKTGEGLAELKRELVARVAALPERATPDDGLPLTEPLVVSVAALERLLAAGTLDLVLAANEVRAAETRIGEAIGATYSADLLERLFSRFCVGK